MSRMKVRVLSLLASAMFAASAFAAQIPLVSGPLDPGNALGNENALIQMLNGNVATGAGVTFPKNVLDNSNFQISQRGTGASTCGTTSGMPETAYGPDRWACDINEATGAGQITQVSATPTPVVGAQFAATLVRNSGSLTNPACMIQEIPYAKVLGLQGQMVDFSVYLQALAGLSADNGNQANLYVFSGTTADQGLGTMTTSVKAASVTASSTTNLVTYTNTLVAGQPVYFTAATMPTGLTTNQVYYVSSTGLTTSVFSVANSYAAAIAGTVTPLGSSGTTVVVYVPYITPAWTGLSVLGQSSAVFQNAPNLTLSATAWARYSTGLLPVPNNAAELAVAVCFTPTVAVSGGSTDGLAVDWAQLEAIGPNGTGPTQYESKDSLLELLTAQRYAYQINEPASSKIVSQGGAYETATICDVVIKLPVSMRVAPTLTLTGGSATTWAVMSKSTTPVVLASTWLIQDAVIGNTVDSIALQATTASTTAGFACELVGAGGGASIFAGADF